MYGNEGVFVTVCMVILPIVSMWISIHNRLSDSCSLSLQLSMWIQRLVSHFCSSIYSFILLLLCCVGSLLFDEHLLTQLYVKKIWVEDRTKKGDLYVGVNFKE